MATINCPGGHTFSDGELPSPYGWTLISDANLERALDVIIEKARDGEDVDAQAEVIMGSHGIPTYKCPECGRLLLFENGIEKPADSYRME